ncbi:MAG: TolC family protein [Planctomycetaceae bacterium]|nr:TolC family protein [Planctomycetaceae bacterium]
MNGIFPLLGLLITVIIPTGSTFAQPNADSLYRNRYLLPTPPLSRPIISATEPKAPTPAPLNNPQMPPAIKPASGIAALPKRAITFAEITAAATHNHPGIQQAKRQAEALRGTWIQAGLKSNPTVEYSAEEVTEQYAGKQGVTFSQPITPRYKRDARQAAVNREYKAADETYRMQCQKAMNDALLAAYQVAFVYRKCLLLEELSKISQEALYAASELLQAGEIARSMFLDIKIKTEQMQIALRDAEIAYRTACKELAILLALSEGELIEITDSVETLAPDLSETTLFAEIQAVSPELRQAYAEVDAARARLRQQHAEAGIDYDAHAKIAYNTETKQSEFSFGVAIPLQIFDRNQGNIQRAQSELSTAQRNAERLERAIAQRYEQQMGKYRTARNRVVSYKGILADAREAFDLALAAYRRGEYASHELIEARQTFLNVNIEYLDGLHALMESHVLLRGALLSGGLEKPGGE